MPHMVYNVMPPVRRGGLYSMSSAPKACSLCFIHAEGMLAFPSSAPKGRTPEDQIGRPTQDAALELLVVGVILAMMLILSLR